MYRNGRQLRKRLLQTVLLTLIAVWLSACARPARAPEPTAAGRAAAAPDLRGARVFAIDPQASQVNIFVYRGGALARLGHNHVITSKSVRGRAWVHPQMERSGFELEFPVAELVIDDEAARAQAGAEFSSKIAAADREGTRKNMLRPEVLDAERYPLIRLRSGRLSGELPQPQATALITIRDVERETPVPLQVQVAGQELTATGEFDIRQTDFGVKPFSVVLGALEVQDQLHIEFHLIARQQESS